MCIVGHTGNVTLLCVSGDTSVVCSPFMCVLWGYVGSVVRFRVCILRFSYPYLSSIFG